MKKVKIVESKGGTFYIKKRNIPKGCYYCLKGAKAVLFLNGICQRPDHCQWYCPISESRKNKEYSFINEIRINSITDLFEELNICKALGMSITGGEPLFGDNLEKTIHYIYEVKQKFGSKFHIHLYSNGLNFNETIANRLSGIGLDEIRFHPHNNNWNVFSLALKKGMSVGAEVPVIPNKPYLDKLERLILYLDNIGADFINLNELEYCFPNSSSMKEKGFCLEPGSIASVVNSKDNALKLVKKMAPEVSIKIHFCPIIAKDYYQLRNRYIRRANSIRKPYEKITDEGLLIYTQVNGDKSRLLDFIEFIKSNLVINPRSILLDGNVVKLPLDVILEDKFLCGLEHFHLECHIVEILPFRKLEYFQITESTPLKTFIDELNEESKENSTKI
ncbi:MAG: hypothetical protein ACFFAS_08080 [Promethearchaeota archaeon]